MNTDRLTYQQYLDIQRALKEVLSSYPNSNAYFDFTRAPLARSAFEKYQIGENITEEEERAFFVRAILPKSGDELSKQEFDRLQEQYGAGVSRVSIIDHNLSEWLKMAPEDESILITGGACALESRDTKLIQYMQGMPNGGEIVREYIQKLFLTFPTWTQITSALIPSSPVSVMYDETFPWHLRVADYGISNAESETQRVYDAIFVAVQRYAELYDPKNIVLKVPFTSLNLKEGGYLDRWFETTKKYNSEIEARYNLKPLESTFDSFMKAWVEYTYSGPEILSIVKSVLKERYKKVYDEYNLHKATIHVRSKQIDHLDTERLNHWMHSVILGNDLPKNLRERKNMLFSKHHRNTIGLYNWMRDEYDQNRQLGFAGFLDQSYRGKLIHEDSVREKSQLKKAVFKSIDTVLNSPLRLNQKNVDESIEFLARFKNPHSVSFSKEILSNFTSLKEEIQKLNRKIEVITDIMSAMDAYINLIDWYQHPTHVKSLTAITKEDFCEKQKLLISRFGADGLMKKFFVSELSIPFSKEAVIQLIKSFQWVDKVGTAEPTSGVAITVEPKLISYFYELLKKEYSRYIQKNESTKLRIADLEKQLKIVYRIMTKNITTYQNDDLAKFVDIIPLGSNIFVSYMQQLLFVPPIRAAYHDLVQIEKQTMTSREKKEEMVIAIINEIFPVVERCIRYIMIGGDYPWKERFEFEYRGI